MFGYLLLKGVRKMKKEIGRKNIFPLVIPLIIAALVLVISSCGGGGGGDDLPVTMSLNAVLVPPTQVKLSWSERPNAMAFHVYLNGVFMSSEFPRAGTNSASFFTLTPASRQCFRIYAIFFPFGALERSNDACVVTLPDSPPLAPTGLQATAVSSAKVNLTWKVASDDYGVTGYRVYRNGAYLSDVSETVFADSGLNPATSYCYSVTARDISRNESVPSEEVCSVTLPDLSPPSAPTGLSAYEFGRWSSTIRLEWTAASDDGVVRLYRIYRDGLFLKEKEQPKETEFVYVDDVGLPAMASHCYTVTAVDAAGNESIPSASACVILGWMTSSVADGGVFEVLGIGADSLNQVHIGYFDSAVDPNTHNFRSEINYATRNITGDWDRQVVDAQAYYGSMTSMTLDSQGRAHFSYPDQSGGLRYTNNVFFGHWTTETVDNPGYHSIFSTSIAVDAAGHGHMGWLNSGGEIMYGTNVSGLWKSEKVVEAVAVGGAGVMAGIVIGADGRVHLGYYFGEPLPGGDFRAFLRYANNTGGNWSLQTVDVSGDVGWYASMGVDGSGRVHISYFDPVERDLKYATGVAGDWRLTTLASVGDVGEWVAIAVDAAGAAHISFVDRTAQNLKYATNVRGHWEIFTVDSREGIQGKTAIAVDRTGLVHIAYQTSTVHGQYVRYATNRP